jgi:class 3 adenylate cyclase
MKSNGNFLKQINNIINKGGLKLKFIGFSIAVILITVLIISSITINLMTNSIEKKAFEVATSSIRHIGDFSKHALLERSYENKLDLSEVIKRIEEAKVEGFLDISIYERVKKDKQNKYLYLTGFKQYKAPIYLEDEKVIDQLSNAKTEKILRNEVTFIQENKKLASYQFIKPILYTFKKQTILLGVVILNYDKEAITGVVRNAINVAIFVTLIIVIFTTMMVYYVGLKFTRPILMVTQAANNVSKGNLDVDLKIKTNDEIGQLAQSFNGMVKGLRERKKMSKFVSGSTMNMIQKDDTTQLVLGGEYRTLTIFFSDIRGFTAMSETKKPEEVVEIINYYLDLQSRIIKKYNGDIDKFVGDEIMASFSGQEGTLNALRCALEIQESIIKSNKEREKLNLTVCQVGIGINKGEVIVGNMGSKQRMDFTSIGSVVNLAARICSVALPNEILIEQKTANELENEFAFIKKEAIKVKGFNKPIEISSVNV